MAQESEQRPAISRRSTFKPLSAKSWKTFFIVPPSRTPHQFSSLFLSPIESRRKSTCPSVGFPAENPPSQIVYKQLRNFAANLI